jgi:hypothetical protein
MRLVALLIALAVVPSDQAGTTSFVGTWIAQFEGTTYVRLELNTANDGITGGMSLGNIELDQKGAVRRVEAAPSDLKPISDVTQRRSTLMFLIREGDEPDRFEFRLLTGGLAELHILLSDDDLEELKDSGIETFRPLLLTKQ